MQIVPRVKFQKSNKGELTLFDLNSYYIDDNSFASFVNNLFNFITERFLGLFSVRFVQGVEKQSNIVFNKIESNISEYYTITVTESGIVVEYADRLALRNAIATLNALIETNENNLTIPFVRIEDYPDNKRRSAMFDLVRDFIPIAELKYYIKELGFAKYNCVHLHLMDSQRYALKSEAVPELNKNGDWFYTKEELKDLVEYYTIATNNDSDNFIDESKKQLIQTANEEYDKLKEEHIAYWKKYWKQSSINIEDKNLEKLYYRSWYLFASCSRKGFYPMPLQGVWTADDDMLPPWKGDYHYDLNVQLSYQSYLKANHLKEGEVLLDYLWGLKSTFEKYAKEFYNVEGLLIPATATLLGKPIGGWAHYAFSPTMTIWAIQSFDEYYLYSGDEKFFKERVYPIFKDVGTAIYQLLEEKNGKLYLPLSSSPEIFDDTRKAYLKPNSNFDLALMRYLYQRLICFSEKMGESSNDYKNILSMLDDIAIRDLRPLPPGRDFNGFSIKLNSEYTLEESHRHFSHLMCLYPLHLINYDTEEHKMIYEGSIEELERYGTGRWVGYSFPLGAQIYAMAYKGNSAYQKLCDFENGFVAENGFHLNGDFKNFGYTALHYRPFTLEALYCYCDALHEMLMQDHQGYVHLFPAIPNKWKDASFTNLRSVSGILVSAVMKNKSIKSITLQAMTNIEVKIKNNFTINESIVVVNNGEERTFNVNKDGLFVIELKKGLNKIYL